MNIKFENYLGQNIGFGGFKLGARDAYDSARNIEHIFCQRTGWFQKPKPIPIKELRAAYKILCPDMDRAFPGVIDKIVQVEIVRQLGFITDENGNVSYPA